MICVATFYSHFGAIRFKKECDANGWPARLMPVPREISSSCGTCVRFEGEYKSEPPEELEQLVEVCADSYRVIYKAEGM